LQEIFTSKFIQNKAWDFTKYKLLNLSIQWKTFSSPYNSWTKLFRKKRPDKCTLCGWCFKCKGIKCWYRVVVCPLWKFLATRL